MEHFLVRMTVGISKAGGNDSECGPQPFQKSLMGRRSAAVMRDLENVYLHHSICAE